MATYAINYNPLLPVRAEAREGAEMETQILFGELMEVGEDTGRWAKIRNLGDEETGWVDCKMLTYLTDTEYREISGMKEQTTLLPMTWVKKGDYGMCIPAGSIVRKRMWRHGDKWYQCSNVRLTGKAYRTAEDIIGYARRYMNAPYLWGGKTIMGIDCSGLVQIVMGYAGIKLKRNARDQALQGQRIDSLGAARMGDAAFFGNEEGRIIHTGILTGKGTIIHASGRVKEETINETGIYSDEQGQYTHVLMGIRRYF